MFLLLVVWRSREQTGGCLTVPGKTRTEETEIENAKLK